MASKEVNVFVLLDPYQLNTQHLLFNINSAGKILLKKDPNMYFIMKIITKSRTLTCNC